MAQQHRTTRRHKPARCGSRITSAAWRSRRRASRGFGAKSTNGSSSLSIREGPRREGGRHRMHPRSPPSGDHHCLSLPNLRRRRREQTLHQADCTNSSRLRSFVLKVYECSQIKSRFFHFFFSFFFFHISGWKRGGKHPTNPNKQDGGSRRVEGRQ